MSIDKIKIKFKKSDYTYSEHAVKRMIKRNIARFEIEEAIINGEVIEEYPDDKYSPSCLIHGKTKKGRDLHVQISLPPTVVVITTYLPDTSEWIDGKTRR